MPDEDRQQLRVLAKYLVGPAEIGELLGVEANTINVWKVRHAGFPASVRRLRSGDVWDVREIRDWAQRTGRSFREDSSAPTTIESEEPSLKQSALSDQPSDLHN